MCWKLISCERWCTNLNIDNHPTQRSAPRPGNVTTDIILGDYGGSFGQKYGDAFVSYAPPTVEAVGWTIIIIRSINRVGGQEYGVVCGCPHINVPRGTIGRALLGWFSWIGRCRSVEESSPIAMVAVFLLVAYVWEMALRDSFWAKNGTHKRGSTKTKKQS